MIICECVHKRRKLGTADAVDAVHFGLAAPLLRASMRPAVEHQIQMLREGAVQRLALQRSGRRRGGKRQRHGLGGPVRSLSGSQWDHSTP